MRRGAPASGAPSAPPGPFVILVLGGSQGAESVNRAVLDFLREPPLLHRKLRLIHQSGARGYDALKAAYEGLPVESEVKSFFTDVGRILREADLFVGRAGALALAEISAASLPSILIPLPWAADDHQTENARSFADAGAAFLVPERDLSGKRLGEIIKSLMENPGDLWKMGAAAGSLNPPDAAEVMAERLMGLIAERRKKRGKGRESKAPEGKA